MPIWGELASLGAALVWAISSLLLKPLSSRFPALALNGLRTLTAAIFFALLLLVVGRASLLGQVPVSSGAALLSGTIIGMAVGESLFLLSLRYLDVSRAYPISMCGYPIVTILLAALFLGAALTLMMALGTALVLGGTFLVVYPRGGFSLSFSRRERTGLGLVGLTVASWGIATVLIGEGVRGGDILAANVLRLSGVALVLLGLSFRDWGRFWPHSSGLRQTTVGALTGLLSFGIGGWLFLVGLKYAGAGIASVLSAVSPLFLVPMASLFLKERVTRRLLLGVVIAVAGVSVVVAA